MRIISKKRLKDFWETERGADSRKELELWHAVVKSAEWDDYSDAKQTFGSRIDVVGDCAIFDIRGNDYRLICRIRFESHKVYVLKVMTHEEYDLEKWKSDCGCFVKPADKPRRAAAGGRERRKRKRK
jgi:mRNA interferase HigB